MAFADSFEELDDLMEKKLNERKNACSEVTGAVCPRKGMRAGGCESCFSPMLDNATHSSQPATNIRG